MKIFLSIILIVWGSFLTLGFLSIKKFFEKLSEMGAEDLYKKKFRKEQ